MTREKRPVAPDFGTRLAQILTERGLSVSQLAARLDLTAPAIRHWLSSHRHPEIGMLWRIAEALDVPLSRLVSLTDTQAALLDELIRAFNDPAVTQPQKSTLAWRVEREIGDWGDAAKSPVEWCVIPVAGWQPRVLENAEVYEEEIEPAIEEAREAGLSKYLLIVGPEQRRHLHKAVKELLKKDRKKYRNAEFGVVVQRERSGLGDAVKLVWRRLLREPFAVIFPDERRTDESAKKPLLEPMLRIFSREKCSVVAVTGMSADEDLYNFGIADVSAESGGVRWLRSIDEKPKRPEARARPRADERSREPVKPELRIVGRYILTPEIFHILQLIPRNKATLRRELSDGINRLARLQTVAAMLYDGQVETHRPAPRWSRSGRPR